MTAATARLTSVVHFAPVEQNLRLVCAALRGLCDDMPEPIRSLVQYAAVDRGKLLRPALLLLSGELFGAVTDDHVRAATILELIHNATLLHDDVLDHGCLRRGIPTVNRRWGNRAATVLGDLLLGAILELSADLPPDLRAALSQMVVQTCDGEIQQTAGAGNFVLTEQEYLAMIGRKTATLFEGACYLGARLSSASAGQHRAAAHFGYNVGMAYQIMDDLLDIVGDGRTLRKTLGTDLSSNKPTLPLIHALCALTEPHRTHLLCKLQAHAVTRSELLTVFGATASTEYVLARLHDYADAAIDALIGLPQTPIVAALMEVPRWVLGEAVDGLTDDIRMCT